MRVNQAKKFNALTGVHEVSGDLEDDCTAQRKAEQRIGAPWLKSADGAQMVLRHVLDPIKRLLPINQSSATQAIDRAFRFDVLRKCS
jgi:hypothetical protein